jgi:hypothetical protein
MRSALVRLMRAVALTSGQTDDVTTNCDLVRVTETTAHFNSAGFPPRTEGATVRASRNESGSSPLCILRSGI